VGRGTQQQINEHADREVAVLLAERRLGRSGVFDDSWMLLRATATLITKQGLIAEGDLLLARPAAGREDLGDMVCFSARLEQVVGLSLSRGHVQFVD
jgi:hypothetical protein